MKIEDTVCRAKGTVSPSFIDLSTGRRVGFDMRHNTLSYMSAEAMAAAFGGDADYIPCRVGFIYGNQAEMPIDSAISRDQSWSQLVEDLSAASQTSTIDVQIVGFSYPPTLGGEKPAPAPSGSSDSSDSGDDSGDDYNHLLPGGSNAITFHAVSNSQDYGAAFGNAAFHNGDYIYQALLLGMHSGKYYILSRVSLKDGDRYLRKPDGFEVALDWTVVFR